MLRKLCSFVGFLALLLSFFPAAYAIEPASPNLRPGIDISVYQGQVDFAAVRRDRMQGIYIRSSYGSSGIDTRFRSHTRGAAAAGIPYGFYHYVTARTPAQARQQARFFSDLIAGTGYQMRPAMDWENFGDLTSAQASAIAVAFLSEVEKQTGYEPVLYCNAYDASYRLNASAAKWPLWVADYDVQRPQVTANWSEWIGFQYTDEGTVAGINGFVDRDHFTPEIFLDTSQPGTPQPSGTFAYTVQRGDTLWRLARRYDTTVSELVRLNRLQNPNRIYAGETLQIPEFQTPSPNPGTNETFAYRIRRGDTLWGLAHRYGTMISELARLNRLQNPNRIYAGEILQIPQSQTSTQNPGTSGTFAYTIRQGDTLWGLARRYGTTVSRLMRLNSLSNPDIIYAGVTLRIPG